MLQISRHSYLFTFGCAFLNISYRLLLVSAIDTTKEVQHLYNYDFNVTSVKRCPMNKTEHEEAEARLGCKEDQGYHCTPDIYHLNLIEFCYPKKRILVHTGNCLELADIGILNHVKCQNFSFGCPEEPYFSNEIYKYPACLGLAFECFMSDKTCLRKKLTMLPVEKFYKDCKQKEKNVFMVLFIVTVAVLTGLGLLVLVLKRKNILVFERKTKKQSTPTERGETAIPLKEKDHSEDILCRRKKDISVPTNEEDMPMLKTRNSDTSFHEPPKKGRKIKRRKGLQSRGFNDLHLAAKDGNFNRFKKALEECNDIGSTTRDGRNCLHIAAYFGHHDICKNILSKCKSLFESKDNNKMNPAHWAALGGKVDILELMLEYGCDVAEKTNPYEENILLFACIGNRLEVCKFVKENFPGLLRAINREGWNALQYAAKGGHLEIFKFLHKSGMDIKSISAKTGKNSLFTACENGHIDIISYILEEVPELIRDKNNIRQHVGHFAAKDGNPEILSLLLTNTGNDFLKKPAENNINILHVACKYANLDFCKKLKEMKILYNLCQEITEKGWNAALFITERSTNEDKRIKILELLVEDDWLDVYHVSRAGKTILYNACVNQSKKLVKYLLDHYPDLNGIERALEPKHAAKSDEISAIFERHDQKEIL